MIYVRPDARHYFPTERSVADFLNIPSELCRQFKNRRTGRFVRKGRAFFIKVHRPGGWVPILEDLVRFRVPQVGAKSEWLALQEAAAQGISAPRIVAFGEEGKNLASQTSFLITEEIAPAVSLEKLAAANGPEAASGLLKRRLIREVAAIARRLHAGGLNHRDFYLCHFLLTPPPTVRKESFRNAQERPRLHLIDLHRAQRRSKTPRRWIVKDLAGLLFSAFDLPLSGRDLALFVRCYRRKSLRHSLAEDEALWRHVCRRARGLYRKCHQRPPLHGLPSTAVRRQTSRTLAATCDAGSQTKAA